MDHTNPPAEIMQQISETQDNIVRLRDARQTIELNLADLNMQIDADVTVLAELQERLNAAIAAATHKAVGG